MGSSYDFVVEKKAAGPKPDGYPLAMTDRVEGKDRSDLLIQHNDTYVELCV